MAGSKEVRYPSMWQEKKLMEKYIAHKIRETGKIQTVMEHDESAAVIAEEKSPLAVLKDVAWMECFLHDAGKLSDAFQIYINHAIDGTKAVHRGDVNHSTAGGIIIEEWAPKTLLSKMIQTAIYSHHGVRDCLDPRNGKLLFDKENVKPDIRQAVERFNRMQSKEDQRVRLEHAKNSVSQIKSRIMEFEKSGGKDKVYGPRDFYLGMYERLLLSLLVEGDRTDTADFMQERKTRKTLGQEEVDLIWDDCISNFESYNSEFQIIYPLDQARQDISVQCQKAAEKHCSLYRLTVPTGGGKTCGSLRFALHHARIHHKRHIIYVAPYNSILEQNANEIRNAVGRDELVLEHHSNVTLETEEDWKRYDSLTENWESLIVVTTAVQLLQTLFSSGIGSVRRMYSLCSSVIVFDEVQALPVRVIELFNLAINFLTIFAESTVVLCSATQPLFDKLPKNRLLPPVSMVSGLERYSEIFTRTTLADQTQMSPGGLTAEGLCGFADSIVQEKEKVLIIVNTKACARAVYEELRRIHGEYHLFHLSTNMCAKNRQDKLERIKEALNMEGKVICVSTQLIEAGVNLSFHAVIRSLAGLDSVVQAAGRCNRHGENKNGNVYIVKMSPEAENVSRLTDIRQAQEAMETVLFQYRRVPESLGNSLTSVQAMNLYYECYFNRRIDEMKYNVDVEGVPGNLVDLLSANDMGKEEYTKNHPNKTIIMAQAFKTAGDLFEVIPEDGKIDVVVEAYPEAKEALERLENPYLKITEQKLELRKLQMYTVGISEQMKTKLGNAVTAYNGGKILVLDAAYYNFDVGVSETPNMKLLDF